MQQDDDVVTSILICIEATMIIQKSAETQCLSSYGVKAAKIMTRAINHDCVDIVRQIYCSRSFVDAI
jgi:hypothetical protein